MLRWPRRLVSQWEVLVLPGKDAFRSCDTNYETADSSDGQAAQSATGRTTAANDAPGHDSALHVLVTPPGLTRKTTVEQVAAVVFKQSRLGPGLGLHLAETVLLMARRVRDQGSVELFSLMRAFFRPQGSLMVQEFRGPDVKQSTRGEGI